MLFFSSKENKLKDVISLIAKIALVILLLVILSDKNGFSNYTQHISRVQNLNMDMILSDFLSFGKITMFNISLFETLGFVCLAFVFISSITYIILLKTEDKVEEKQKNNYIYKEESSTHFTTNNIYLLTNKFIC